MRKTGILTIASLLILAGLTACSPSGKKTHDPQQPAENPTAAEAPEKVDESSLARLLQPEKLTETAPDRFLVDVKTTKGVIRVELIREWAPLGVDRFYNLVRSDFFSDIAMFRMVSGFVVQFGIHGSPLVSSVWREANIKDDPVTQSNVRGTLTFATAGKDTRTTQLFINLGDNLALDQMGFSPIGKIITGMDIVDALNYEYGEQPNQGKIQMQGNKYLKDRFPNLDYIQSMTIVDN